MGRLLKTNTLDYASRWRCISSKFTQIQFQLLHFTTTTSAVFNYNYRGRNKCAILSQSHFGANAQNLRGALFYMTSVNKASCSTVLWLQCAQPKHKLASDKASRQFPDQNSNMKPLPLWSVTQFTHMAWINFWLLITDCKCSF